MTGQWRPQILVRISDNRATWVPSRMSATMHAFAGIVAFLADRETVRRGYVLAARLLTPGDVVAAQEFATFVQYEDRRASLKWNRIKIEVPSE